MNELTGAQRKYLRSLAHHLDPVCYIGKNGVTDAVIHSVSMALDAHELIKVKFNDHKDEKRTLAGELETATESHMVGLIGNIAILYREQSDPEKRLIALPA